MCTLGAEGRTSTQKYFCFFGAVRSIASNRWPHVDHDCHPMFVSSPKDTAQLSYVARIVDIYIGIAKVQLKTGVEIYILRASTDFGNGIGL